MSDKTQKNSNGHLQHPRPRKIDAFRRMEVHLADGSARWFDALTDGRRWMIYVAPEVARQDDALWSIADYLERDGFVQAMFWTDHSIATEALVAQININDRTALRRLERFRDP